MSNRSFISDDEVDKAVDFLRDNAREAAEARANRVYVIEFRKYLKATIMKEHANLSAALQEREAYSDPRYLEHLEAIREAVKADASCEYLREAASAKIEAWRTASSNERAIKI